MNCSWFDFMDSVEMFLSVSPIFAWMSLEIFSLLVEFSSRLLILAVNSARVWMRLASERRRALTSSNEVANLWFACRELERSISS